MALNPRPLSANTRSKNDQFRRSATAMELHNHFHHKNIYPTFSTGFAVRQKYFNNIGSSSLSTGRPKSSINYPSMRRAYSTALIRATSRKLLFDGGKEASPKDAYDEDLLFPKRSLLTLMRIGMVYFGIEVLFSLEIALAVPILLKLKVPES